MINKRIIACLLMSACIFSVGSSIFNIEANAVTTDKAVVEQKEGVHDSEDEIMPMVAGIVTVSSKSGANIRTDAGTSYSKIPPAAAYGEEIDYNGKQKTGTDGYTWYQVVWNGKVVWISSQVSWLG